MLNKFYIHSHCLKDGMAYGMRGARFLWLSVIRDIVPGFQIMLKNSVDLMLLSRKHWNTVSVFTKEGPHGAAKKNRKGKI